MPYLEALGLLQMEARATSLEPSPGERSSPMVPEDQVPAVYLCVSESATSLLFRLVDQQASDKDNGKTTTKTNPPHGLQSGLSPASSVHASQTTASQLEGDDPR
jgi:hypothetical protein